MNAGLWALNAARKGREKPIVPGSSAFILEETAANLRATKDAIIGLNLLFESSIACLNNLIDDLNNGASYEDLEIRIQHSLPAPDSPIEDSFRSSSILGKSDYDLVENSTKPELLLQNSERVSVPSVPPVSVLAPPVIPNEIAVPQLSKTQEKHQSPNLTSNSETEPAHAVQNQESSSFLNHETKVKLEHMSHDRTLPQEDISKLASPLPNIPNTNIETSSDFNVKTSTLPASKLSPPFPKAELRLEKSPPKVQRTAEKKTASETTSNPSSLSPVKLVNGRVAPLTSPNVDLSFIPIAKSVNRGNHAHFETDEEETESSESNDDADNSFQAISTAIRKSFAGKTSMGQNSGPPSTHDDTQSESEVTRPFQNKSDQNQSGEKLANRSFEHRNIRVKTEHEPYLVKSPLDAKPRYSRSRSFNSSRYTSSLFVSLPKKESIAIHPPNKIRSEKPEIRREITHRSSEHKSPEDRKIQPRSEAPVVLEPIASEKKTQEFNANSSLQKIPVLTQEVPSLFSGKTFSKAFPPVEKVIKTPLVTLKVSPKKDTTTVRRPSGRLANRTTIAGSPVRRGPAARPLSIKRSPIKSRTPVPLTAIPLSSSENSSRSPTKYSHRHDPLSLRGSPTIFLIHESDHLQKRSPNKMLPILLHLNSKFEQNGKSTTSEKGFSSNRFLTTALLPDNSKKLQKLFLPESGQSTSMRAFRETHGGPSKVKQADGLLRGTKPSLQPEFNSKPKITLNLHSKQDLKPAKDPRGVSNRAAISPEKRDKSKMLNLQTTVIKGMKPLPNHATTQILPRKRALGNAIPLPDEARGNLRKDSTKRSHAGENTELKTPSRTSAVRKKNLVNIMRNPGTLPDALPDIPSDDEVLRTTKYIESWAETPEILRTTKENKKLDPDTVFGEFTAVDMNKIFR